MSFVFSDAIATASKHFGGVFGGSNMHSVEARK